MLEIERPAEARAAPDRVRRRIVVGRRQVRSDELAADPLVVALCVVVVDEFVEQVPKVPYS